MSSKKGSFKEILKNRTKENKWKYSTYSKINPEVEKNFPFQKARENQLETISEIVEAIDKGYKYIVLEAGTGTGKSAIAATLASMYDSTYILTVTKQLQEQYLYDFNSLGFKLVKGRGNFKCKKYAEENIYQNCDEGRCVIEGYKCEYSIKDNYDDLSADKICEYDCQKFKGLISDVVISNYHYLYLELNHVGDFTKRNLMIFDEAHNVESSIMNQLKLELDRKNLKEYIGINLSKETIEKLNEGDYNYWIQFINKIKGKYQKEFDKIKNLKRDDVNQKRNYLKKRIKDCALFVSHIKKDPSKWIFDYDSYYGVGEFKPVKVDNYAKETFFDYGEVCIFMSATILDYKLFAEWLGLNESEVYAIRQKSPFEINRNPIITFDKFDMSYRKLSSSAPKTINTIIGILDNHKNEKGLIHTVSYSCKNYLKRNIPSSRLIDHKTYNRTRQLNKFKNSEKPLVLISPSMNEGVDLPGDLCRFQIIYKIPYPNTTDKQTNKRMKMDNRWYNYKTALALVQTVGRGMRYEDDYCITYFIDNRLYDFVLSDQSYNNFLPDTFIDAIDIEPTKIDKSKVKPYEKSNITVDEKRKSPTIDENFNQSDITTIMNDGEEYVNICNIQVKVYKNPDFIPKLGVDDLEMIIGTSEEDDSKSNSEYMQKVDEKYKLTMKGIDLLEKQHYEDAIKFYNDLLSNELFVHDYHPFLKLVKAYKEDEQYENELRIIKEFFVSGIYCRKSTLNWFKKRLKELDDLGYYDYSQINELELEYKHSGAKNQKYSKMPVPLAVDIKGGRKNINNSPIIIDPKSFDDFVKVNPNLSYDEKVNFKYYLIKTGDYLFSKKDYPKAIAYYTRLLSHELFANDYHPYWKLAKLYGKDKQKINEGKILIQFFKSGIYCNGTQFKKFKNRLNRLNNYGHFDHSQIPVLEREFNKNGALNRNLSNEPVPIAIEIKKAFKSVDNVVELKVREKMSEQSPNNINLGHEKPSLQSLNDDKTNVFYSKKYFDDLAKEITQRPGYVSDRELLKHTDDDFVYIGGGDIKLNEKADRKNEGMKLEKEDKLEAIRFYDDLKKDELFKHDYWPYRRQCILFKNRIKDDVGDWNTIKEIFENEIYLNAHQYIWLNNKVMELIVKLGLDDNEINEMELLLQNFDENHERFQKSTFPIAEKIIKDEDGQVKVLSDEKYDYLQDIFYVKELGVGYIRRFDYENAIPYYRNLLNYDFLYFKYLAYKQLGKIYKDMNNKKEFKRIYESN